MRARELAGARPRSLHLVHAVEVGYNAVGGRDVEVRHPEHARHEHGVTVVIEVGKHVLPTPKRQPRTIRNLNDALVMGITKAGVIIKRILARLHRPFCNQACCRAPHCPIEVWKMPSI